MSRVSLSSVQSAIIPCVILILAEVMQPDRVLVTQGLHSPISDDPVKLFTNLSCSKIWLYQINSALALGLARDTLPITSRDKKKGYAVHLYQEKRVEALILTSSSLEGTQESGIHPSEAPNVLPNT